MATAKLSKQARDSIDILMLDLEAQFNDGYKVALGNPGAYCIPNETCKHRDVQILNAIRTIAVLGNGKIDGEMTRLWSLGYTMGKEVAA